MNKLVCAFLFLMLSWQAYSQEKLLWDFRLGIGKEFYEFSDGDGYTEKFSTPIYSAELGLDIPIKQKFAIQPSIIYKYMHDKDAFFYFSDTFTEAESDTYEDKYSSHFLEIPILFGYKLPLSENQKIRFSAGPYVTTKVDFTKYEIGMNLRVAYEYKKFNVGVSTELPCFNNPFPRYFGSKKPGVYLNLGIKFHSKTWKSIGSVAAVIGTVAGTVGVAVMESQAEMSSTSSETSETTTNSTSNSKIKGKANPSDRDVKWMQGNYSTMKRVYSECESQLIKMSTYPEQYNDRQRRDIQAKMRQTRQTITQHGGTCAKSTWEDWSK